MAEVTDPIWPKVSSLDPFLAAVWKTNMRNIMPVWITHTATDEQEKNPNPQRRLRFGAGAGFPRLRTSIGFGRAGLMISALGSSPAMVRRCFEIFEGHRGQLLALVGCVMVAPPGRRRNLHDSFGSGRRFFRRKGGGDFLKARIAA